MLKNAILGQAVNADAEQETKTAGRSISAVIVNYCTRDLLRDCLVSIRRDGANAVDLIVVDNHSTDDSAEMVRVEFPEVRLILNLENLGFSKANNQGIKEAHGKYILLLNSDTIVFPGALHAMKQFMEERPDAGAVSCRLVYADGRTQPSMGTQSRPGIMELIYRLSGLSRLVRGDRARRLLRRYLGFLLGSTLRSYLDSYVTADSALEAETISGACLMLRRKAIDQVGLLDENFFMYLEDLDYCIRLRKAGWKLFYLPSTKIVHLVGKSSGGRMRRYSVHSFRSLFYFYSKHYSALALFSARVVVLTAMCIRWAWNTACGAFSNTSIYKENRSDLEKVIRLCLRWNRTEGSLRG